MSGCTAAIAAAQRYREAEARCPKLAYGLHLRGKCRRLGGDRVCGDCVHELGPQEMLSEPAGASLSGLKPFLATKQRQERFRRLSDRESAFFKGT